MIDNSRNGQPLDLSYLKEMAGDSPEFLIEMLDTFVEQIPKYMEDLEKAVFASNWKATYEFAHKLKPTFYYVGREDVRDHVQTMEKNAREGKFLDEIPFLFQELKHFLPILFRKIAETKASLS